MTARVHLFLRLLLQSSLLGVWAVRAVAGAEANAPAAAPNTGGLYDHWFLAAQARTLKKVLWTGQQFVAAGGSTILNSPDGITWTQHEIKPSVRLFDMTTSGNLFVAVGDNGVIVTSPDLNAWSIRADGDSRPLHGVFYNGRDFLAMGTRGAFAHSTDGVQWANDTLPNNPYLGHGLWANGQLVVSAENGIWLYRYLTTSAVTYDKTLDHSGQLNDIAWGNNLYVAVGDNANIYTSPDALSWTKRASSVNTNLHAALWTGQQFVIVGDGGAILTSLDGNTWQSVPTSLKSNLAGVAYNGKRLAVVAEDGSVFVTALPGDANAMASSPAAVAPTGPPTYTSASLALLTAPSLPAPTAPALPGPAGPFDRWTLVSTGESPSYFGVRWIANHFVALGQHAIMTSPDGITWKNAAPNASGTFYDIATNGKIFVAIGDKGGLATSPDLQTWTNHSSPTAGRIYGIYWINGQFFATGDGTVYTSADGIAWGSRSFGGSYFHHGTIAGSNLVITDSDGVTITDGNSRRHITSADRMLDVAYNGSLLVAVGSTPVPLWISADGVTWQKSNPGTTEGLGAVTWTGTQFFAAGGNGTILHSTDGQAWTARSLGSKSNIYAVAGHGDTVVAVTSDGLIYTNQNVATVAPPEISFAPGPAGSVPQLELKCATTDAKIFYTEDGSEPNPQATPYTAPFSPAHAETLRVRAYKDGLAPSAVASANFIINSPEAQK